MASLRYDLISAALDAGETRHAQTVMRELGIIYKEAIPQSMADQWWFIGCSNVPEKLPAFLSPMQLATPPGDG
jgi:hypothetical protein